MNIVRVSFYVSGEFKYKNVVLVVVGSAELWVDYPAGVTSVTKPSMPDHVYSVLTRGWVLEMADIVTVVLADHRERKIDVEWPTLSSSLL